MTLHIGTSGWSYRHWRGAFYPAGLPARRELEHASSVFSSLEINRSFYSLLTASTCEAWREGTPKRFVFALKGSRFITHAKKLREVETPLANFFASGPLALKEKLGPIVWQLPANLGFDEERLDTFFRQLPRTTDDAARLARGHDARVKAPHLEPGPRRVLRHAIEPRHPSFFAPRFTELARRHRVAIALADSADWPSFEQVTADFMYLRLHGSSERTYASAYDAAALEKWAAKIRAWLSPSDARPRVRSVFVYFDNDMHAHAPRDAEALRARLADL